MRVHSEDGSVAEMLPDFLPDRFYPEAEVIGRFGFSAARLKVARESEGLRYECREKGGGKRIYRGEWLIKWLERDREGSGDGGSSSERN